MLIFQGENLCWDYFHDIYFVPTVKWNLHIHEDIYSQQTWS